MKLIMIILFISLSISCASTVYEGHVITEITQSNSYRDMWIYKESNGAYFYAAPYTYQVGDTVHFCKK